MWNFGFFNDFQKSEPDLKILVCKFLFRISSRYYLRYPFYSSRNNIYKSHKFNNCLWKSKLSYILFSYLLYYCVIKIIFKLLLYQHEFNWHFSEIFNNEKVWNIQFYYKLTFFFFFFFYNKLLTSWNWWKTKILFILVVYINCLQTFEIKTVIKTIKYILSI